MLLCAFAGDRPEVLHTVRGDAWQHPPPPVLQGSDRGLAADTSRDLRAATSRGPFHTDIKMTS